MKFAPVKLTWTDERLTQLAGLWRDGLTASQIADELGGVTRNAVIGAAHRLKLPARRLKLPAHPSTKKSAPGTNRNLTRFIAVRDKSDPGLQVTPSTESPLHAGVALMDLERHHCRWPNGNVGTLDFSFCGADAIESKPYCGYHLAMARQ